MAVVAAAEDEDGCVAGEDFPDALGCGRSMAGVSAGGQIRRMWDRG